MRGGDAMFLEFLDYLTSMSNDNELGNANGDVINYEMNTTCEDYGNACCLFDKVLTILNSKEEVLPKKNWTNALNVCKFHQKNNYRWSLVSIKKYIFYQHIRDIIRLTTAIVHLGEIRLEKAHQTQFQNNKIASQMSDKIKGK